VRLPPIARRTKIGVCGPHSNAHPSRPPSDGKPWPERGGRCSGTRWRALPQRRRAGRSSKDLRRAARAALGVIGISRQIQHRKTTTERATHCGSQWRNRGGAVQRRVRGRGGGGPFWLALRRGRETAEDEGSREGGSGTFARHALRRATRKRFVTSPAPPSACRRRAVVTTTNEPARRGTPTARRETSRAHDDQGGVVA